MKKSIFCILMVIAIVASMAISSLGAEWYEDTIDFESFPEGLAVNDAAIGSETNLLRNGWTPSRGLQLDTIIVSDEEEENLYMMYVGPQWLTRDQAFNASKATVRMDIRQETIAGFAGVVLQYGLDYTASWEGTVTQNDYFFTEIEAVNSDDAASYVMATGYGWTQLKNSTSKIRIFVRTLEAPKEGSTDNQFGVIYYDFDTGVDLTKGWHTVQVNANLIENKAQFILDYKILMAELSFSDKEALSSVPTTLGRTLDDTYFRNAEITDGDGKIVASTESALIADYGHCNVAASGVGTVYDIDELTVEEYEKEFEPATATPEATDVPAVTDAPATEVPATDAPATEVPATDAPATEAPAAKSGCGSVVLGIMPVIALAGACIVFKKKH